MKILLLGANGQVGWELKRVLFPLGEILCPERLQLDLSDLQQVDAYLASIDVDVIINAAAYTAVDKAESEQEKADCINHLVPKLLAEKAKHSKALLIHYSTDYVFDGSKSGYYREDDATAPLGVYGSTKLAGEQAIQNTECDYLIFRTSWVYAARGSNFLLTIRRLAREREEMGIVADQIGAPTWARVIAQSSAYCLYQSMQDRKDGSFVSDLYHLTCAGSTSWHGFANAIVKQLHDSGDELLKLRKINPIPTTDYPTPAARPENSKLDLSHLQKKFELVMPDWDKALKLCMQELSPT